MNHALNSYATRAAALRRLLSDRSVAGRVSPVQQFWEMVYLKVFHDIGPLTYYRLGLDRSSIPWAEKRRFASIRWYNRTIELINPREYRIAAWNKIVADGVLRLFNVPTPAFYGFVSPTNGQTRDGRPLRTAADLERLIRRLALREACFKLVGGWSGRGFLSVTFYQRPDRVTVGGTGAGREIALETFWRDYLVNIRDRAATERQKAYGYLCQEVVVQHPAVAALHKQSLNTIRVWMAQVTPGQWEMYAAVLRMGSGANKVDNGSAGGIAAPIDLATGRLGRAVRRGRRNRSFREYDRHPSSGAPIEGFAVPMWGDVLPLCRRACSAYPYLRLLGLDIAVTPDEVIVIEVEADPHATHQAHLGRGLRPLLSRLASENSRALQR